MNQLDVIKETISVVNSLRIGFLGKLGVFEKTISDGVSKYISTDPRIVHFITFLYEHSLQEVSFFCGDKKFSLSSLESLFGEAKIGYNFRENYTQFTFYVNSGCVESVFFVKDNKFEAVSGGYEEKTPRGVVKFHSNLEFDAFCLKLNDL